MSRMSRLCESEDCLVKMRERFRILGRRLQMMMIRLGCRLQWVILVRRDENRISRRRSLRRSSKKNFESWIYWRLWSEMKSLLRLRQRNNQTSLSTCWAMIEIFTLKISRSDIYLSTLDSTSWTKLYMEAQVWLRDQHIVWRFMMKSYLLDLQRE